MYAFFFLCGPELRDHHQKKKKKRETLVYSTAMYRNMLPFHRKFLAFSFNLNYMDLRPQHTQGL